MLRKFLIVATTVAANDLGHIFDEFKALFERKYKTAEEELEKFKIFVENFQLAEKMKLVDPKATYGWKSPLADMSQDDFNKRNSLMVTPQILAEHAKKAVSLKVNKNGPKEFDWRVKGAVTPVKNQAQCGSCWAFASVANVEGQNYLKNGKLLSLSEQELVDCSDSDNGCNGGLPVRAYDDMIAKKEGFELEKDYDYEGLDDQCRADKSKEVVFLSDYFQISTNEDQIAQALLKYGPLAIGLNASPMQMYMGGISDPWFCNPMGIDHAVTLVGYGEEEEDNQFGTATVPFWIIKNSWGPDWGEKGYYRLVRGKGKCGMNRMVATAVVAKSETEIFV